MKTIFRSMFPSLLILLWLPHLQANERVIVHIETTNIAPFSIQTGPTLEKVGFQPGNWTIFSLPENAPAILSAEPGPDDVGIVFSIVNLDDRHAGRFCYGAIPHFALPIQQEHYYTMRFSYYCVGSAVGAIRLYLPPSNPNQNARIAIDDFSGMDDCKSVRAKSHSYSECWTPSGEGWRDAQLVFHFEEKVENIVVEFVNTASGAENKFYFTGFSMSETPIEDEI